MKISIIAFLVLLPYFDLHAQEQSVKEELTKEQKWLLAKTKQFYHTADLNVSTATLLRYLDPLLTSNALCQPDKAPFYQLQLEGDRINEQTAVVRWEVTGEKASVEYVLERRYHDPFGLFDSIGVIKGRGNAAAVQSYQFTDRNDNPDNTFYRIRQIGKEHEAAKSVKVKGYGNIVKVLPNPVTSTSMQIAVSKFKTDEQTSLWILDAKGSVLFHLPHAFSKGRTIIPLPNLRLPKGSYQVQVSNQFNRGMTTFVVQ